MKAGDLLLVRGGTSIEDRIIMAGTRSVYSHVAIGMDGTGKLLAEATHTGIAFADAAKYDGHETRWIDTGLTDDQRIAACRFASSCIGQRYGVGQIAAITVAWLTHGRAFFGVDHTETCSSLCARAMEHAGVDLPKSPELFSPGDLSAFYAVVPRLGKP